MVSKKQVSIGVYELTKKQFDELRGTASQDSFLDTMMIIFKSTPENMRNAILKLYNDKKKAENTKIVIEKLEENKEGGEVVGENNCEGQQADHQGDGQNQAVPA